MINSQSRAFAGNVEFLESLAASEHNFCCYFVVIRYPQWPDIKEYIYATYIYGRIYVYTYI
jgi:hypothetical protein